MEPIWIFWTRPVNFKIIAGWPASRLVSNRPGRPVFLQKVFVHCSMYLMKNFQKGGMGEVLKFVTLDGGIRKKAKKIVFVFFLQKWLNFKTFFIEVTVWKTCFEQCKNVHKISIKTTGGHKLNYIRRLFYWYYAKAKKWSYNFLANCDRLFAICRAANAILFLGRAAFAVTKR